MKRNMKLKHILKAKYLLIALILPAVCYVLVFLYTEVNPPEIDIGKDQSQQQPILFFTDIYPRKVLWLNKNKFLVQEEQRVIVYDSRNRKSKTIYEITTSVDDTSSPDGTGTAGNPSPSVDTGTDGDTSPSVDTGTAGNTDPLDNIDPHVDSNPPANSDTSNDTTATIKNCWWTGSTIVIAVENEKETEILQYNIDGETLPDNEESQDDETLSDNPKTPNDETLSNSKESPDSDKPAQLTLENSDFVEIDNGLICSTKNFIIENPEETATLIEIAPFNPGPDETNVQLKTNLTIKPLNCSRDKLILTQSSPFLEKSLYSWVPGEASPVLINIDTVTTGANSTTTNADSITTGANSTTHDTNPNTDSSTMIHITNVSYFLKHKTAGIQTSDSNVILINTDTLVQHTINLQNTTDAQPSTNDVPGPWTLTNSNEVLHLGKADREPDSNSNSNKDSSNNNNNDNEDTYKIQLLRLQDPKDTNNPVKIKTITEFSSGEDFLDIYPNNSLTSFALISEFGELWILQI